MDRFELVQQLPRIDRFDHVLVEPGLQRAQPVLRLAEAGDGDHARLRRGIGNRLTQDAADDVAVAVRQSDIAEHDVRLEPARGLDALLGGVRYFDLVTAEDEDRAKSLGGVAVVFHHQYAQLGRFLGAMLHRPRRTSSSAAPALAITGHRRVASYARVIARRRFPTGIFFR